MKSNKMICSILSLAMLSSIAPLNLKAVEIDENLNLALHKVARASSFEVTTTDASKATDGDLNTHWGTAQNKANNEWLEVDLDGTKKVRQINVNFERKDAEQNILSYKVEVKEGNTYKEVFRKTEKAKQKEIIVLDKDYQASHIKVTILNADHGTINWLNVGISEIEVFSEIEEQAEAVPNKNYMEEAKVSVSSVEAGAPFTADKINDGKRGSGDRWASGLDIANTWVEVDLGQLTTVKSFDIQFENRSVSTQPSNVKKFDISYQDSHGTWKKIQTVNNTVKNEGYNDKLKVVLSKAVNAKKLKLDHFEIKAGQTAEYDNVSIVEMEVYANDITQKASLDSVVESIQGGIIDKDTFELPKVPEGFMIESNGADFEQIIGKDSKDGKLSVHRPLTDKEVKISFNVKEIKTGKVKNTGDKLFAVKGVHTQQEGKNTKPVVIPEIQEWYSDQTTSISIDKLSKVVYSDDSLKAIAEEFVSDYADFTGIKLALSKGKVQEGAISFAIDKTDGMLGEEGYTMDINENNIVVKASSITGNMYGMQTILQMYKEDARGYKLGTIRDYPRFETRGLLLDVARKPISLEMMKEITRTMRYYKMNDFQAHLSDNYIWLEDYGTHANEKEAFKAYEAFRLESGLKNDKGETPTAKDYFISKKDFQKFIHDERALGMKIVPEIDVPAHATSFTKVWPELAIKDKVSNDHPLIDHFDLTKTQSIDKIKEIFNDYTQGNNPTFDSNTTIHIGADEFLYNPKSYRDFVNEIVPFIKNTNTVRMWGGLTRIKDNPLTAINRNAIENVEMNLWSKDWADGKEMYDLGFKLINTIDDYGYMVPNGSRGRANAYGDLLNVERIFNSFDPSSVRTGSGYINLPSGDDQVLGAAYAIWNDNIDKRASGLTESDLYWRFFDALPFYAEKTWAATGKEKGTADRLSKLANEKGTGPNTNPYYQEDKKGKDYAKYDFEKNLKDSSENNRDLVEGKNTTISNGTLCLGDEVSYVTSPMKQLGNGNALSFDIKLNKEAKPGDILFEEDAAYGTHDIRIMSDGKLGFTRELYEYSFDYKLPVNKKVNIQIYASQQETILVVDDEFIGKATGKFVHNKMVKKEGITNATFALPLERIGSKTNSLEAEIDNVIAFEGKFVDQSIVDTSNFEITSDNEQSETGNEGPIKFAFDNNLSTIWHSKYNPYQNLPATVTIDMKDTYKLNKLTYVPRLDGKNGVITEYSLYYKTKENEEWTPIAEHQQWDKNNNEKVCKFESVNARFLKFVAHDGMSDSNKKFASAAEFRLHKVMKDDEKVDKSTLQSRVDELKKVDTSKLTTDSVNAFKSLINEAENLLSQEVTQQEIETMLKKLENAEDVLISQGNINELQELVKICELMKEDYYTIDTWNVYQNALNAAKLAIKDHSNLTQKDVDVLKETLEEKKNDLELKEADYSKVDAAIEKANSLNKDAYKDFTEVEKAIDAVVRGKKIMDQELVDEYANAIEKAINSLESKEVVNKDALKEVIEEKPAKDKDTYTSDSWKVYQEALANANKILKDEKATQADVDEARISLQKAIKALKENEEVTPLEPSTPVVPEVKPTPDTKPELEGNKPEVSTKPENETVENEEKPVTGVSTNIAVLWSMLLGAGAVVLALDNKKRRAQR